MTITTASHIANYFLERAEKEGGEMTLMKLVKLVYLAHGWSLSALNRSLLGNDEKVEAWKYGPVIPSIYHEFKEFGNQVIPKGTRSVMFYPINGLSPENPSVPASDKELQKMLDLVWKLYGNHSGTSLMRITHQKDTPWSKTYKDGEMFTRISDDLIRDHFNEIINQLFSSKNGD